jgi:hypothetical protein
MQSQHCFKNYAIATAVLPLPTANNPDRAGASAAQPPWRGVPARLRGGWSRTRAGSSRLIAFSFPQLLDFPPHKTEQASLLFSHLPPAISVARRAANPIASSPAEMDGSSLKSAQLLEQMRLHLATDAGKELIKKVGLVYQLNIAPKVSLPFSPSPLPKSPVNLSSFTSQDCVKPRPDRRPS